MKKFCIITPILMVLLLSSMGLKENKENQVINPVNFKEGQPLFHKGMITIKVKEEIKDLQQQRGNISFNSSSLDSKVSRYEVNLLEKRFKYDPKKLKKGMPDLSRIYRIEFPEQYPVTMVARAFSEDPNIEYAEPVPIPYIDDEPNDEYYSQLYYLPQISAPQAWDTHKGEDGTEEVIVAIVDTGTDWKHPDLAENTWQNLGEDADGDGKTLEYDGSQWIRDPDDLNGIDDDDNGYIDDVIGWDFHEFAINGNGSNPDPLSSGHGTHCSGLAAGRTNNEIGISSISWNIKHMPVQASDDINGVVYGFDGIIYAAENGAHIISNSWGTVFYSYAHHEAIDYALELGSIILAAGGNDNEYTDNSYPSNYPNVVSVAAVNSTDQRAFFSNYGPNIGISAPGVDVMSTTPGNTYQSWDGTSMSTPIVAGLFGLVKSYQPDWTADQVITQVLGTADDIDAVNPGYENLLGTGRINADSALNTSNVTLPQEISLNYIYSDFLDLDGNHIPEAGDTISLTIKLRNYNYGVGADNATFTLKTEDPDITILNESYSGTIPPDNFFTLENVFQFKISDEAVIHFANFDLITNAAIEITWGDTLSFELMVAPSGILLYQGDGLGNAFSGDFINEFLIGQGLSVFYTTHFPPSLNGFDAAFLSYGNYGSGLVHGAMITPEMTEAMNEYLINGGSIYAECGSFFGIMEYLGSPYLEEAMELFGIEEVETPLSANSISSLNGLPGSICDSLVFTGSTQYPTWYIDIMTPNDNGIAAFEEDYYGTVAVQSEGEYGQKTFCFSYALAHLEDNDLGTRDELMTRIVDFFFTTTNEEEHAARNDDPEISVYPNPCSGNVNIRISPKEFPWENIGYRISNIEIFTTSGTKIKELMNEEKMPGIYEMEIDITDLPAGVYYCVLKTNNGKYAKKFIKL